MPDLQFRVEAARVLEYAAQPSLQFDLHVENTRGESVRSVMLNTQIRIVANRRHYTDAEENALAGVFGDPRRWTDTLRSFLWTHTVTLIPSFTGSTVVHMPVVCTYDFDVASAKYFHALEGGEIPLEFLFSGTVFYAAERGLQVAQISWDKETSFRLPVSLWKAMMGHYFPNSAWVRLRQDVFDRLYAYRTRMGLPTWEAALEDLLRAGAGEVTP